MTPCEVCYAQTELYVTVNDYRFVRCSSCEHQFVPIAAARSHTDAIYGDEYFSGGGAGYADYIADAELVREHARRYARLIARYSKPSRVLDVGAAAGFTLCAFAEHGWTGEGLEPNAAMAAYGVTQFAVPVSVGTAEDARLADPYGLVTMLQVVAHFYDVRRAFSRLARATNVGGWWLIETWNAQSLTARILGRRWHEYSPPSVLRVFTPRSLRQLCAQFGFQAVAQGHPQKWISGRHARSLLQHKGMGGIARCLPARARLPYPSEDLFWLLLRKHGDATRPLP